MKKEAIKNELLYRRPPASSPSQSGDAREPLCVADCRFSSENFGAAGAHDAVAASVYEQMTFSI